jgi:RNase H-like domain found in reverse transcriptase
MPLKDLEMHTHEQRHESFAFISRRFVRSSYKWSVTEKKAFAILAAMARLRYLNLVCTVHVHRDHWN